MAEVKKFLDSAGVSALWKKVVEQVSAVDTKVSTNTSDIAQLKVDVAALHNYDDTDLKASIAANTTAIGKNTDAIAVLNGTEDGSVEKTVSNKIAAVVAGAPEKFDTLKEIADWIDSDTTGAAKMANDITALQGLVGETKVSEQVAAGVTEAKTYADTKFDAIEMPLALTTEEIDVAIAKATVQE